MMKDPFSKVSQSQWADTHSFEKNQLDLYACSYLATVSICRIFLFKVAQRLHLLLVYQMTSTWALARQSSLIECF